MDMDFLQEPDEDSFEKSDLFATPASDFLPQIQNDYSASLNVFSSPFIHSQRSDIPPIIDHNGVTTITTTPIADSDHSTTLGSDHSSMENDAHLDSALFNVDEFLVDYQPLNSQEPQRTNPQMENDEEGATQNEVFGEPLARHPSACEACYLEQRRPRNCCTSIYMPRPQTTNITDALQFNQPTTNQNKRTRQTTTSTNINGHDSAHQICRCARTACLKLYCDCFTAGIYCSDECGCIGCRNKPEYGVVVMETKEKIASHNPLAFVSKIGNVGCSNICRCEGCENSYGVRLNSSIETLTNQRHAFHHQRTPTSLIQDQGQRYVQSPQVERVLETSVIPEGNGSRFRNVNNNYNMGIVNNNEASVIRNSGLLSASNLPMPHRSGLGSGISNYGIAQNPFYDTELENISRWIRQKIFRVEEIEKRKRGFDHANANANAFLNTSFRPNAASNNGHNNDHQDSTTPTPNLDS
ncbi:protein tesmin/TSO1-like CXC 2 [Senna tora]|uniref:Protein tesmin/TSO1-like CXC 2 n=1 Tax=Senna tora TaxID=362788 RepID=A0A834WBJ2_9FABA|nr:protein tesmin/TSO1-like CXC 2 [Senna tora]